MPQNEGGSAAPPLILTLDIGSSSVRAMLFDAQGRAVAGVEAREAYSVRTDASGAAEDDPDAMLARIWRCLDEALAQAGPLAQHIRAVAVDTLVSNMIALDAQNRPLTPIITYADTRNDADAVALRSRLDEHAVHQRTGCMLRTSYWPARLVWFRRTQPHIFEQAARWVTIGEYLELTLFGRCRVSTSAAAWSGLLERTRLVWDEPLLAELGVQPEQLSPPVDASEPLAELQPEYAARWPALRSVPWFPAIGDGAAANLGSGCAAPGHTALTVGTTGALRVVLPQVAHVPRGLWCYRVDRTRALLGGATSEGGNVYAWMQEALRLGAEAEVEAAVAALPPDGHGLTVLPLFAGERSPGWAGDARATISGITLGTTPLDIVRAGLEAVAYRFALIARALFEEVGSPGTIVASGGALLASPPWLQIIADVLGQPVVASGEAEATSRGTALLALEALGAISSVADAPAAFGATYTPTMEHHAIYQAAIERQQRLYTQVIEQE
jgi:gluconokinase